MSTKEPKTKLTKASVTKFIAAQQNPTVRKDCKTIIALMKKHAKAEPKMWGSSIIGFGTYRLIYSDGHGSDWPIAAFSPRKQNMTVYLMPGFQKHTELLNRLGKCSTSKSCLYFKSLNDIDVKVLERLIILSIKELKKTLKEN